MSENDKLLNVVLDIKQEVGGLQSDMRYQTRKLESIDQQVKKTNGRVTKNEASIKNILSRIESLLKKKTKDVVIKNPDEVNIKGNALFAFTKENVALFALFLASFIGALYEIFK